MKRKVIYVLLLVFLPLAIGAAGYILFCPETAISQTICELTGICISSLGYPDNGLLLLLRNYGLDILWAFALSNCILFFCGSDEKSIIIWAGICICFETFVELLQLFGIRKGTFDPLDIVAQIITTLLALFVNIMLRKVYYNEKKNC